jgi:hypothetical protein
VTVVTVPLKNIRDLHYIFAKVGSASFFGVPLALAPQQFFGGPLALVRCHFKFAGSLCAIPLKAGASATRFNIFVKIISCAG